MSNNKQKEDKNESGYAGITAAIGIGAMAIGGIVGYFMSKNESSKSKVSNPTTNNNRNRNQSSKVSNSAVNNQSDNKSSNLESAESNANDIIYVHSTQRNSKAELDNRSNQRNPNSFVYLSSHGIDIEPPPYSIDSPNYDIATANNHSNQMNPNNPVYSSSHGISVQPPVWSSASRNYDKAVADNRANQMNPKHPLYQKSRANIDKTKGGKKRKKKKKNQTTNQKEEGK